MILDGPPHPSPVPSDVVLSPTGSWGWHDGRPRNGPPPWNEGATFYRGVIEVYEPASNSWKTKAPMIAERAEFGAGVVGNLLYAVGGRNLHAVRALNERYTP